MDIELRTIFLAIGDLWRRADLSGGLNHLAGFLLMPQSIALLLGAAFLCTIIAVYFLQRRDISAKLEALSEAMDQQSRNIERMRQSLVEITQVLVMLRAAPRRESGEQLPAEEPGVEEPREVQISEPAAAAIRQELELLRSEILADLSSAD